MRADHDQRRGSGADEEPLDAAVLDHEPEEPRLPCDRGQHGQRGLQHELHEFVGQPGEDGDGRGRREDLRLGFASNDFAGMEKFDGHRPVERRHGDGYSRLLSPHQRAVVQARLDEVEAWQA